MTSLWLGTSLPNRRSQRIPKCVAWPNMVKSAARSLKYREQVLRALQAGQKRLSLEIWQLLLEPHAPCKAVANLKWQPWKVVEISAGIHGGLNWVRPTLAEMFQQHGRLSPMSADVSRN